MSDSKITEIRKDLDPCKQYMGTPDYPNILVQAMGMLPSNINMENSLALIMQVGEVCQINDWSQHQLPKFETDRDGTYECVPGVSCAYAIGVMSRCVDGFYEALYFYGDGTLILQGEENDHTMVYHFIRMSN